ncbi:hypothetical protein [Thalassotalea sp. ND16A]|uniref:hypothetical protein n=1 Tax=Thalassotalea sp. ND16A TaxID=1535422 RepID=UPI00051D98D5|nr:hypothetical protein [Thalassotalea sp. ND16A]KGK00281.1 hypothetical protein ND16A_3617 [Thalassotalea sp. ND16A]
MNFQSVTANMKEHIFICTSDSCDWQGGENDLDITTKYADNMVCCPSCQNDDVRSI